MSVKDRQRDGSGFVIITIEKRMLEYRSLLGYVNPVRKNGTLTPLFL